MMKKHIGAGFNTLATITKTEELLYVRASVTEREALFNKAKKEMEDEMKITLKEEFKISGSSRAEWTKAINTRYSQLVNEKALSKLKKVEEFLKGKVSKEQQFQEEFSDLAKDLNLDG